MNRIAILALLVLRWITSEGQITEQPVKVSHAEPIYFDLIRDLGARKGERELNVGIGMRKSNLYTEYSYLVEYEFAPINRLGLELEIPISFHTPGVPEPIERTGNGIEGIKAAMQYSFFVSEKFKTTMAAGYIFERRITHLHSQYSHTPFFIIAKRWGKQFHSLLYTGPQYETDRTHKTKTAAVINASIHYVLPGTKNFIGIEVNDELQNEGNLIMVRPQIKMAVSTASAIGLALGIPSNNNTMPLDFLIRWVYEPPKKK